MSPGDCGLFSILWIKMQLVIALVGPYPTSAMNHFTPYVSEFEYAPRFHPSRNPDCPPRWFHGKARGARELPRTWDHRRSPEEGPPVGQEPSIEIRAVLVRCPRTHEEISVDEYKVFITLEQEHQGLLEKDVYRSCQKFVYHRMHRQVALITKVPFQHSPGKVNIYAYNRAEVPINGNTYNITAGRSQDILEFHGFDRDEPAHHSEVRNCRRKLIVTMKFNNIGKTRTQEEFVVVDHVLDPVTMHKARLLNPFVFKVRQEQVLQLYGLKFQSVVNGEAKEEVVNKKSANYTGCDEGLENPTCGQMMFEGNPIPFSQGFCCSCDPEVNAERQAAVKTGLSMTESTFQNIKPSCNEEPIRAYQNMGARSVFANLFASSKVPVSPTHSEGDAERKEDAKIIDDRKQREQKKDDKDSSHQRSQFDRKIGGVKETANLEQFPNSFKEKANAIGGKNITDQKKSAIVEDNIHFLEDEDSGIIEPPFVMNSPNGDQADLAPSRNLKRIRLSDDTQAGDVFGKPMSPVLRTALTGNIQSKGKIEPYMDAVHNQALREEYYFPEIKHKKRKIVEGVYGRGDIDRDIIREFQKSGKQQFDSYRPDDEQHNKPLINLKVVDLTAELLKLENEYEASKKMEKLADGQLLQYTPSVERKIGPTEFIDESKYKIRRVSGPIYRELDEYIKKSERGRAAPVMKATRMKNLVNVTSTYPTTYVPRNLTSESVLAVPRSNTKVLFIANQNEKQDLQSREQKKCRAPQLNYNPVEKYGKNTIRIHEGMAKYDDKKVRPLTENQDFQKNIFSENSTLYKSSSSPAYAYDDIQSQSNTNNTKRSSTDSSSTLPTRITKANSLASKMSSTSAYVNNSVTIAQPISPISSCNVSSTTKRVPEFGSSTDVLYAATVALGTSTSTQTSTVTIVAEPPLILRQELINDKLYAASKSNGSAVCQSLTLRTPQSSESTTVSAESLEKEMVELLAKCIMSDGSNTLSLGRNNCSSEKGTTSKAVRNDENEANKIAQYTVPQSKKASISPPSSVSKVSDIRSEVLPFERMSNPASNPKEHLNYFRNDIPIGPIKLSGSLKDQYADWVKYKQLQNEHDLNQPEIHSQTFNRRAEGKAKNYPLDVLSAAMQNSIVNKVMTSVKLKQNMPQHDLGLPNASKYPEPAFLPQSSGLENWPRIEGAVRGGQDFPTAHSLRSDVNPAVLKNLPYNQASVHDKLPIDNNHEQTKEEQIERGTIKSRAPGKHVSLPSNNDNLNENLKPRANEDVYDQIAVALESVPKVNFEHHALNSDSYLNGVPSYFNILDERSNQNIQESMQNAEYPHSMIEAQNQFYRDSDNTSDATNRMTENINRTINVSNIETPIRKVGRNDSLIPNAVSTQLGEHSKRIFELPSHEIENISKTADASIRIEGPSDQSIEVPNDIVLEQDTVMMVEPPLNESLQPANKYSKYRTNNVIVDAVQEKQSVRTNNSKQSKSLKDLLATNIEVPNDIQLFSNWFKKSSRRIPTNEKSKSRIRKADSTEGKEKLELAKIPREEFVLHVNGRRKAKEAAVILPSSGDMVKGNYHYQDQSATVINDRRSDDSQSVTDQDYIFLDANGRERSCENLKLEEKRKLTHMKALKEYLKIPMLNNTELHTLCSSIEGALVTNRHLRDKVLNEKLDHLNNLMKINLRAQNRPFRSIVYDDPFIRRNDSKQRSIDKQIEDEFAGITNALKESPQDEKGGSMCLSTGDPEKVENAIIRNFAVMLNRIPKVDILSHVEDGSSQMDSQMPSSMRVVGKVSTGEPDMFVKSGTSRNITCNVNKPTKSIYEEEKKNGKGALSSNKSSSRFDSMSIRAVKTTSPTTIDMHLHSPSSSTTFTRQSVTSNPVKVTKMQNIHPSSKIEDKNTTHQHTTENHLKLSERNEVHRLNNVSNIHSSTKVAFIQDKSDVHDGQEHLVENQQETHLGTPVSDGTHAIQGNLSIVHSIAKDNALNHSQDTHSPTNNTLGIRDTASKLSTPPAIGQSRNEKYNKSFENPSNNEKEKKNATRQMLNGLREKQSEDEPHVSSSSKASIDKSHENVAFVNSDTKDKITRREPGMNGLAQIVIHNDYKNPPTPDKGKGLERTNEIIKDDVNSRLSLKHVLHNLKIGKLEKKFYHDLMVTQELGQDTDNKEDRSLSPGESTQASITGQTLMDCHEQIVGGVSSAPISFTNGKQNENHSGVLSDRPMKKLYRHLIVTTTEHDAEETLPPEESTLVSKGHTGSTESAQTLIFGNCMVTVTSSLGHQSKSDIKEGTSTLPPENETTSKITTHRPVREENCKNFTTDTTTDLPTEETSPLPVTTPPLTDVSELEEVTEEAEITTSYHHKKCINATLSQKKIVEGKASNSIVNISDINDTNLSRRGYHYKEDRQHSKSHPSFNAMDIEETFSELNDDEIHKDYLGKNRNRNQVIKERNAGNVSKEKKIMNEDQIVIERSLLDLKPGQFNEEDEEKSHEEEIDDRYHANVASLFESTTINVDDVLLEVENVEFLKELEAVRKSFKKGTQVTHTPQVCNEATTRKLEPKPTEDDMAGVHQWLGEMKAQTLTTSEKSVTTCRCIVRNMVPIPATQSENLSKNPVALESDTEPDYVQAPDLGSTAPTKNGHHLYIESPEHLSINTKDHGIKIMSVGSDNSGDPGTLRLKNNAISEDPKDFLKKYKFSQKVKEALVNKLKGSEKITDFFNPSDLNGHAGKVIRLMVNDDEDADDSEPTLKNKKTSSPCKIHLSNNTDSLNVREARAGKGCSIISNKLKLERNTTTPTSSFTLAGDSFTQHIYSGEKLSSVKKNMLTEKIHSKESNIQEYDYSEHFIKDATGGLNVTINIIPGTTHRADIEDIKLQQFQQDAHIEQRRCGESTTTTEPFVTYFASTVRPTIVDSEITSHQPSYGASKDQELTLHEAHDVVEPLDGRPVRNVTNTWYQYLMNELKEAVAVGPKSSGDILSPRKKNTHVTSLPSNANLGDEQLNLVMEQPIFLDENRKNHKKYEATTKDDSSKTNFMLDYNEPVHEYENRVKRSAQASTKTEGREESKIQPLHGHIQSGSISSGKRYEDTTHSIPQNTECLETKVTTTQAKTAESTPGITTTIASSLTEITTLTSEEGIPTLLPLSTATLNTEKTTQTSAPECHESETEVRMFMNNIMKVRDTRAVTEKSTKNVTEKPTKNVTEKDNKHAEQKEKQNTKNKKCTTISLVFDTTDEGDDCATTPLANLVDDRSLFDNSGLSMNTNQRRISINKSNNTEKKLLSLSEHSPQQNNEHDLLVFYDYELNSDGNGSMRRVSETTNILESNTDFIEDDPILERTIRRTGEVTTKATKKPHTTNKVNPLKTTLDWTTTDDGESNIVRRYPTIQKPRRENEDYLTEVNIEQKRCTTSHPHLIANYDIGTNREVAKRCTTHHQSLVTKDEVESNHEVAKRCTTHHQSLVTNDEIESNHEAVKRCTTRHPSLEEGHSGEGSYEAESTVAYQEAFTEPEIRKLNVKRCTTHHLSIDQEGSRRKIDDDKAKTRQYNRSLVHHDKNPKKKRCTTHHPSRPSETMKGNLRKVPYKRFGPKLKASVKRSMKQSTMQHLSVTDNDLKDNQGESNHRNHMKRCITHHPKLNIQDGRNLKEDIGKLDWKRCTTKHPSIDEPELRRSVPKLNNEASSILPETNAIRIYTLRFPDHTFEKMQEEDERNNDQMIVERVRKRGSETDENDNEVTQITIAIEKPSVDSKTNYSTKYSPEKLPEDNLNFFKEFTQDGGLQGIVKRLSNESIGGESMHSEQQIMNPIFFNPYVAIERNSLSDAQKFKDKSHNIILEKTDKLLNEIPHTVKYADDQEWRGKMELLKLKKHENILKEYLNWNHEIESSESKIFPPYSIENISRANLEGVQERVTINNSNGHNFNDRESSTQLSPTDTKYISPSSTDKIGPSVEDPNNRETLMNNTDTRSQAVICTNEMKKSQESSTMNTPCSDMKDDNFQKVRGSNWLHSPMKILAPCGVSKARDHEQVDNNKDPIRKSQISYVVKKIENEQRTTAEDREKSSDKLPVLCGALNEQHSADNRLQSAEKIPPCSFTKEKHYDQSPAENTLQTSQKILALCGILKEENPNQPLLNDKVQFVKEIHLPGNVEKSNNQLYPPQKSTDPYDVIKEKNYEQTTADNRPTLHTLHSNNIPVPCGIMKEENHEKPSMVDRNFSEKILSPYDGSKEKKFEKVPVDIRLHSLEKINNLHGLPKKNDESLQRKSQGTAYDNLDDKAILQKLSKMHLKNDVVIISLIKKGRPRDEMVSVTGGRSERSFAASKFWENSKPPSSPKKYRPYDYNQKDGYYNPREQNEEVRKTDFIRKQEGNENWYRHTERRLLFVQERQQKEDRNTQDYIEADGKREIIDEDDLVPEDEDVAPKGDTSSIEYLDSPYKKYERDKLNDNWDKLVDRIINSNYPITQKRKCNETIIPPEDMPPGLNKTTMQKLHFLDSDKYIKMMAKKITHLSNMHNLKPDKEIEKKLRGGKKGGQCLNPIIQDSPNGINDIDAYFNEIVGGLDQANHESEEKIAGGAQLEDDVSFNEADDNEPAERTVYSYKKLESVPTGDIWEEDIAENTENPEEAYGILDDYETLNNNYYSDDADEMENDQNDNVIPNNGRFVAFRQYPKNSEASDTGYMLIDRLPYARKDFHRNYKGNSAGVIGNDIAIDSQGPSTESNTNSSDVPVEESGSDFEISLSGKIHIDGGSNGQPISISIDAKPGYSDKDAIAGGNSGISETASENDSSIMIGNSFKNDTRESLSNNSDSEMKSRLELTSEKSNSPLFHVTHSDHLYFNNVDLGHILQDGKPITTNAKPDNLFNLLPVDIDIIENAPIRPKNVNKIKFSNEKRIPESRTTVKDRSFMENNRNSHKEFADNLFQLSKSLQRKFYDVMLRTNSRDESKGTNLNLIPASSSKPRVEEMNAKDWKETGLSTEAVSYKTDKIHNESGEGSVNGVMADEPVLFDFAKLEISHRMSTDKMKEGSQTEDPIHYLVEAPLLNDRINAAFVLNNALQSLNKSEQDTSHFPRQVEQRRRERAGDDTSDVDKKFVKYSNNEERRTGHPEQSDIDVVKIIPIEIMKTTPSLSRGTWQDRLSYTTGDGQKILKLITSEMSSPDEEFKIPVTVKATRIKPTGDLASGMWRNAEDMDILKGNRSLGNDEQENVSSDFNNTDKAARFDHPKIFPTKQEQRPSTGRPVSLKVTGLVSMEPYITSKLQEASSDASSLKQKHLLQVPRYDNFDTLTIPPVEIDPNIEHKMIGAPVSKTNNDDRIISDRKKIYSESAHAKLDPEVASSSGPKVQTPSNKKGKINSKFTIFHSTPSDRSTDVSTRRDEETTSKYLVQGNKEDEKEKATLESRKNAIASNSREIVVDTAHAKLDREPGASAMIYAGEPPTASCETKPEPETTQCGKNQELEITQWKKKQEPETTQCEKQEPETTQCEMKQEPEITQCDSNVKDTTPCVVTEISENIRQETEDEKKKVAEVENMLAIMEFMRKVEEMMTGGGTAPCPDKDGGGTLIQVERVVILPQNQSDIPVEDEPQLGETTSERVVLMGEGIKHIDGRLRNNDGKSRDKINNDLSVLSQHNPQDGISGHSVLSKPDLLQRDKERDKSFLFYRQHANSVLSNLTSGNISKTFTKKETVSNFKQNVEDIQQSLQHMDRIIKSIKQRASRKNIRDNMANMSMANTRNLKLDDSMVQLQNSGAATPKLENYGLFSEKNIQIHDKKPQMLYENALDNLVMSKGEEDTLNKILSKGTTVACDRGDNRLHELGEELTIGLKNGILPGNTHLDHVLNLEHDIIGNVKNSPHLSDSESLDSSRSQDLNDKSDESEREGQDVWKYNMRVHDTLQKEMMTKKLAEWERDRDIHSVASSTISENSSATPGKSHEVKDLVLDKELEGFQNLQEESAVREKALLRTVQRKISERLRDLEGTVPDKATRSKADLTKLEPPISLAANRDLYHATNDLIDVSNANNYHSLANLRTSAVEDNANKLVEPERRSPLSKRTQNDYFDKLSAIGSRSNAQALKNGMKSEIDDGIIGHTSFSDRDRNFQRGNHFYNSRDTKTNNLETINDNNDESPNSIPADKDFAYLYKNTRFKPANAETYFSEAVLGNAMPVVKLIDSKTDYSIVNPMLIDQVRAGTEAMNIQKIADSVVPKLVNMGDVNELDDTNTPLQIVVSPEPPNKVNENEPVYFDEPSIKISGMGLDNTNDNLGINKFNQVFRHDGGNKIENVRNIANRRLSRMRETGTVGNTSDIESSRSGRTNVNNRLRNPLKSKKKEISSYNRNRSINKMANLNVNEKREVMSRGNINNGLAARHGSLFRKRKQARYLKDKDTGNRKKKSKQFQKKKKWWSFKRHLLNVFDDQAPLKVSKKSRKDLKSVQQEVSETPIQTVDDNGIAIIEAPEVNENQRLSIDNSRSKSKIKKKRRSIRKKRQLKAGGAQVRGGQDCMDRRHPPHVNAAKYQESAHCLRFSDLWYSVYEFENPIMEHTVYLQLFEKHTLPDGSTHWDDLTQGTMVRLGTFIRHQRDSVPTIAFTYSGAKVVPQKQAHNLDPMKERLLVPSPVAPQVAPKYPEIKGGSTEYLVVQANVIGKDANECDRAGVGFTAFATQTDRCGHVKGTCLKNQPLAFWRHDVEAREAGKPGCYFLSNFAAVPTNPIKYNVTGSGSREYLGLEYHSPHVSAIDIEVRADYNAIVRVGSSGRVTEVYVDSTAVEHTIVTVVISNMGLASSPYQPRISDCPTGLPVSWAKAKGAMQVIPPQHNQRVILDLYGQLYVNEFHCSVEVVNHHGELVAMRRIRIQKMDRCFCVWHCLCACVGSVSGLGCQPMSPEHYHAAGFQGPVPMVSMEPSMIANAVKDVMIFSALLVLLLLLLGVVKWLIGIFLPTVGRWGLDSLLDGSRMEEYFEPELKCRCLITDDEGTPVHPDTGQRTVRICNRKVEFFLNLIFFLTYPIAICCNYAKKSLGATQADCCPDESKMCLLNEKEGCPKLICVNTYGDSRNSKMEAEDTKYVMNELKRSQESLQESGKKSKKGSRSRSGSSSKKSSRKSDTGGKHVAELLKKRVVFRNLNAPIGGLNVPSGVGYSLRGYFMHAENGGYRFITPCPFKQHWLIENNKKKPMKPPQVHPSNLFMRTFCTAKEVYDSNEISIEPRGFCINVQFCNDE